MKTDILINDEIRNEVLTVLSGHCFFERDKDNPRLFILSPWISDVEVAFKNNLAPSMKGQYTWTEDYFTLDFNIRSINLSYALFLLKLHSGADISIILLPFTKMKGYSVDYIASVKNMLDFLDEIGCNIFVNEKLHSKLLLANDLGLLGSFNLSMSALYEREEIGVRIANLEELVKLESYSYGVIHESQPYGYSSKLKRNEIEPYPEPVPLTRGYVLDYLIRNVYQDIFRVESGGISSFPESFREFLYVTGDYYSQLKEYSENIDVFYLNNIRKLVSFPKGIDRLSSLLECNNLKSVDEAMNFLKDYLYRKEVPKLKLRIERSNE